VNRIDTLTLGHTTGAGVLVGDEMEETSVGKAQLLLKEQPNKRLPSLRQAPGVDSTISVHLHGFVFIMVKQKIDIFDLVHQNDALDSQS